jgi:hypothetical protein
MILAFLMVSYQTMLLSVMFRKAHYMTYSFKSLFMVGALAFTVAVDAQDRAKIPSDLLAVDHQRCMRSCVPGFGETACKPLCDCTVQEFQKRMDFERYLDLAAELAKNEIGPESRKLLDTIALFCADKVEKSGIDLGGNSQPSSSDGTKNPE